MIKSVMVVIPAAVHPESPGVFPVGHQTGSAVLTISAAVCVAKGTGVLLASNTTTDVPVGTDPTNVEMVAGVVVSPSFGATVVPVESAVAAGAGVVAGATAVSVDTAGVDGAGVSAGATSVAGADVAAAGGT